MSNRASSGALTRAFVWAPVPVRLTSSTAVQGSPSSQPQLTLPVTGGLGPPGACPAGNCAESCQTHYMNGLHTNTGLGLVPPIEESPRNPFPIL